MRAHDLQAVMRREPDFTSPDGDASFWMLGGFGEGMAWVGRFRGTSPWERHAAGHEVLHQLEGEVDVTVVGDEGPETTRLQSGSVFIVPPDRWHRVSSTDEVVMWGVTAGRTEHHEGETPPAAG